MSSSVLVIDARARNLSAFVASATVAQADNPYQLVLRHGLDMTDLRSLLSLSERQEYRGGEYVVLRQITTELPVILMGNYQARSSAGYVAVHTVDSWDENRDGHRKVLVVGGLGPVFGKKGLRPLGNPISATLIRGPVEIEEFTVAGNSNRASAEAALEGVRFLTQVDHTAVYLVEGQSDHTYVVRFISVGHEPTELPVEHREQMFSRENIVRRMVRAAAYHDLVRRGHEEPSEEEIIAAARQRLESYFAAKAAGEEKSWERLGPKFGLLNMSSEAIVKVAEELGMEVAVL